MKTKAGVKLHGLQLVMRDALIIASETYQRHGKELVITSTVDGTHSPGSLHPYGYAFDIRTRFFVDGVVPEVTEQIRTSLHKLSRYFDVIQESTHIHIEFDIIRFLREKENERTNTAHTDNLVLTPSNYLH